VKAKSYIQYKNTSGELVTETLWIQNLEPTRVQDGHLMLLLGTEEDSSPRITTNNDGIEQYVFNEVVTDGAYTFVTMDQAKVLKALKMVRNVDGDIWLKLPIHFNVPANIFNSAPVWE
jgi:hypothetical protein